MSFPIFLLKSTTLSWLNFMLRELLTTELGALVGNQCFQFSCLKYLSKTSNPVTLMPSTINGAREWSTESYLKLRKPITMLLLNSVRNLGIIEAAGDSPLTSKGTISGTKFSLQINTQTSLLEEAMSFVFGDRKKCVFYFIWIQFKNFQMDFMWLFSC